MTCGVCLGRRAFAIQFYPRRRPLFVECHSCKMKRRARWNDVKAVATVVISAAFAIGVVAWMGR